jgi:hypothetical protein
MPAMLAHWKKALDGADIFLGLSAAGALET